MTTFIRDATPSAFSRREISDFPSYVGSITPLPIGLLVKTVGTYTAVSSLGNAVSQFFSGSPIEATKSVLKGAIAGGLTIGVHAGDALNGGDTLQAAFQDVKQVLPLFFQFFPETISDNRSLEIANVSVPFYTNPLPTFVSSSIRMISFSVDFAQEKWNAPKGQTRDIAKWDKHNFNVGVVMQALRGFCYPISVGTFLFPQPIILNLPGTRIGIDPSEGVPSDSIMCIMKGYSAIRKSFFPDGQVRVGSMQLDFQEFTQADNRMLFTDFAPAYHTYALRAAQDAIKTDGVNRAGVQDKAQTRNTNSAYDNDQLNPSPEP
jgi:hypothetical protein